ncbi:cation efflux family protein [Naviculisporaceae sp. PSN 640]
MAITLRAKQRLAAAMIISFAFFVTELAVAFKTNSLALMADSFHYMNDLLSFGVALGAIFISERKESPQWLTYGWQRAQTLGAFFNGVFLLALGMSIFFQSIERFIAIRKVENVMLILVMGVVGLILNIISACFLHEHHDHSHSGHNHHHAGQGATVDDVDDQYETKKMSQLNPNLNTNPNPNRHQGHRHPPFLNNQTESPPSRDIGMMGVMIHVIGDAINNLGIIIASLFIWFMTSESRYYADPAVSVAISLMIFMTALPLVKKSGAILLQGAPRGIEITDVRHDLEMIPGIESVHEVHIWHLDQRKTIASVHVVVSNPGTGTDGMAEFMDQASTIRDCLHAYGIHSVTLQPELRTTSKISNSACDIRVLGSSSASGPASLSPKGSVSVSVDEVSVDSLDEGMKGTGPRSPRRGIYSEMEEEGCKMRCGSGKGCCEELACCREVPVSG